MVCKDPLVFSGLWSFSSSFLYFIDNVSGAFCLNPLKYKNFFLHIARLMIKQPSSLNIIHIKYTYCNLTFYIWIWLKFFKKYCVWYKYNLTELFSSNILKLFPLNPKLTHFLPNKCKLICILSFKANRWTSFYQNI